ncbi:hypothetical protein ACFL5K_01540 [Gemmatimonadota bacterium]
MNVLVFNLKMRSLSYAFLTNDSELNEFSGSLDDYRRCDPVKEVLSEIKERTDKWNESFEESSALILAFRLPYGGNLFHGPEIVGPGSLAKLWELIPKAPLHLPAVLNLIECAGEIFAGYPQVLVSETSFFVDLPDREKLVALDFELIQKIGIRHYGFNGTLHQAACADASYKRRLAGLTSMPRIVSICLESRPEVAAVIGRRPLMVTSGTTPLDGLPGSTTCGELDPGIVISLSQKSGWGPERINQVLTRESGLKGLTGEQTDIAAIFSGNKANYKLAREIIQYKILAACGAAKAAMGGLDTIVFSGKFVKAGESMGPRLTANPALADNRDGSKATWELFLKPSERVVAEIARTTAACPVG